MFFHLTMYYLCARTRTLIISIIMKTKNKKTSCFSRLFDTVRCNFVRLNKIFPFLSHLSQTSHENQKFFFKNCPTQSHPPRRSPSHLSPLPSPLCIVLKKVYRFILSISSMTGNVEPSLLVQKSVGGSMPPQTLMTV